MIKNILNDLLIKSIPNLPNRKTISKINYSLYLLTLSNDEFYIGYTNDINRRIKEHSKTKDVLSYDVLFNCKSKSNVKILETFLILNVKLFHKNIILKNKRSEMCQY